MGLTQSTPKSLTRDRINGEFARLCLSQFSSIELWALKDLFVSLADSSAGQQYWTASKLLDYFGVPESTNCGPIILKIAEKLASFPFIASNSLEPLTMRSLLKAIAILDPERRSNILPGYDPLILLFFAIATPDDNTAKEYNAQDVFDSSSLDAGWAKLPVIADYDNLCPDGLPSNANKSWRVHARELHDLFSLLLAIFPLDPEQPIAAYVDNFQPEEWLKYTHRAAAILSSFRTDGQSPQDPLHPGFSCEEFCDGILAAAPNIFTPLTSLFQHLLFSPKQSPQIAATKQPADHPLELRNLPYYNATTYDYADCLMDMSTVAQIATELGRNSIWGRLQKLYIGSEHGFSMRSFESKAFKWNAPSILIVSGEVVERAKLRDRSLEAFNDWVYTGKSSSSSVDGCQSRKVVYGCLLNTKWISSSKKGFGDSKGKLFQLYPFQEWFPAKTGAAADSYAFYSPILGGFGFGTAVPHFPSGSRERIVPGAVSLTIDESMEYGVFRCYGVDGEGAYRRSKSANAATKEWEDVFSISQVEVWGCGGEKELTAQAKEWAWEEREARRRREVNLKRGNFDEDRAILELAGLVGGNMSGGSV
ncbi:hypothetical protein CANCADRAFT_188 [Tortispora caseinolytica NRRL Y-17796]|uniref:TLDc domain-containing protein n=1 Tax=Tortispora caseinolytica NRRL Y-17796 TaxID=767744 RepID=A0A1E4TIN4_9ASCO|nr:hypothetical protein CANCADRAFT_188 [Tortispora caseinolytica NRRL Y-17796]